MGDEVKITYETLYELYRREKDRAELQELPSTFFADVSTYLAEKQASLTHTQGSIFDTEAQKSRIQVDNVRKVLKALYDRRESKIINMATIKARTQSIVNLQPLLDSEKDLYNSIVSILHMYRGGVLHNLMNGNSAIVAASPHYIPSPAPVQATPSAQQAAPAHVAQQITPLIPNVQALPKPQTIPVDAAVQKFVPAPEIAKTSQLVEMTPEPAQPTPALTPKQMSAPAPEPPLATSEDAHSLGIPPTISRSVRFLCSVPKFVGPNLEVYGPFTENDTATLPDPIVNVLMSKGRVEMQVTSQNLV